MPVMMPLARGIDRFNEIIGKGVAWAILAAIVISAGNALVRKIFDTSSNAWLELQWYLFGAGFMLAAAWTLKQNEHIRIDILYGMTSRRVQHWIDLIGHLLFLLPFTALMLYYLVPYVLRSYASGEMSANSGGLIMWPAKALLLAGFVLLALQAVSEIIKKIAVMRGEIEDPTPFVSPQQAAEDEAKALAEEIRAAEARTGLTADRRMETQMTAGTETLPVGQMTAGMRDTESQATDRQGGQNGTDGAGRTGA